MKRILNKLNTLHHKYAAEITHAESQIGDKIEFEFFILWQQSDGFVIGDLDGGNAPLGECLEVISEKGNFTHDDFEALKI